MMFSFAGCLRPLVGHFRTLIELQDPLPEAEHAHQLVDTDNTNNQWTIVGGGKAGSRRRQHCFVSVIAILGLTVYGTVGLHLEATKHGGGGGFQWTALASSEHVFNHRIVPRATWPHLDLGYAFGLVNGLAIGLLVVFGQHNSNGIRFQLWVQRINHPNRSQARLRVGPRAVPLSESRRVLRLRRVMKRLHVYSLTGMWTVATVMYETQVWFGSQTQQMCPPYNLRTLLYWLIGFPLWHWYIVYFLFPLNPILTSVVLYIRQRCAACRLDRLAGSHLKKTKLKQYWARYLVANRQTIRIDCPLMEHHVRQMAPLLAIWVPTMVGTQCYAVCAVLFGGAELKPMLSRLLILAAVQMNLLMFGVIRCCALVGVANRRLEALHQRIYFRLFVPQPQSPEEGAVSVLKSNGSLSLSLPLLSHRDRLKAEGFQTHRRLHRYCFRIGPFVRITSNTYFLILTYIVAMFMFLIRNEQQAR